jgi:hypothetical protein
MKAWHRIWFCDRIECIDRTPGRVHQLPELPEASAAERPADPCTYTCPDNWPEAETLSKPRTPLAERPTASARRSTGSRNATNGTRGERQCGSEAPPDPGRPHPDPTPADPCHQENHPRRLLD